MELTQHNDFELPPIQGIEGHLDYLTKWGKERGTERLLGVKPDGRVVFNAVGNDQQVAVPPQYQQRLEGIWLLHNHPSLPAAISIPDIFAASGNHAEGILAVCDDGSTTWTSGINWANANPIIQMIPELAYGSFQDLGRFVQLQVDRAVGDTLHREWKDNDERYVIQSDLICELAVRKGMLIDYHRNSGPDQGRILKAYKARMKDKLQPLGQPSLTRPYAF